MNPPTLTGDVTARIRAEPQSVGWAEYAQKYITAVRVHHKLVLASAGLLFLLGALITHQTGAPGWLRMSFVAGSFVTAGWYTGLNALHILRQFRFDIDVLMFAAAFGAAVLGHYEEGAFLLVLFAFSEAGEELALDKARRAIQALAELAPETATVRLDDGTEQIVYIDALHIGQCVVVRPFDRIPADGVIDAGHSGVDQSAITGESVSVEKSPGSDVFAGTINGEGLLVVRVTKRSTDSTLSKIVKLVSEAQEMKSPTQHFAERFERRYVPVVLLLTITLLIVPPVLNITPRMEGTLWAGWFYQAMAFLTAASPCALAIGTPAAVLSGIARAARIGVLVKGGAHLENLGRVTCVAFDKTGTLTRGKPVVTDVFTSDILTSDQTRYTANEILALAASVENQSTHPLAGAIVAEAHTRNIPLFEATDARQVPARGMTAIVDGKLIFAGKIDASSGFMSHIERFARQGKSTVAVSVDDLPIGVIALADRPRDNARQTLTRLKSLGIRRTITLTGDRKAVAEQVSAELGIDETHADLLPEDKLALIQSLQKTYGPIAMIGDGVNDAPALAAASVGIAMGGAGTDVAMETADVVLMADDLAKLPDAVALSRFSRQIIQQNLFIAMSVIAVLAPLSALGYTYLGVAVLFHEGSTIVVVLNALRILFFKPPSLGG
jgi:Zn2+/Cd2+-exporting ATPase